METINFKLTGLTCGACAKLAQKRIAKIDGVTNSVVNDDGSAEITSEKVITKEEVKNALSDTNYSVL